MKKTLALMLVLLMLLSLAACGSSAKTEAAEPQKDAPTETAPEEKLTIAMLPQIKGNVYFAACEQGGKKAAEELGVDFIFDGPSEARVDRQIELIETYITDGVDAILVAPNDAETIKTALQKARDAGIAVLTFDVDSVEEARDFFLNPADSALIGKQLIECVVDEAGRSDMDYLVMCESLADAGQKAWTDEAIAYAAEKYPDMNYLEIKQTGQDQNQAYITAQDLLKVYPDVECIVTAGAACYLGVIEALKDADRIDDVVAIGMSTPNEIRGYIEEGSVKYDVLWNPIDLGYAVVYAAYNMCNGSLADGDTEVDCGELGVLKIAEGNNIMLGNPTVFSIDNVNDFDF